VNKPEWRTNGAGQLRRLLWRSFPWQLWLGRRLPSLTGDICEHDDHKARLRRERRLVCGLRHGSTSCSFLASSGSVVSTTPSSPFSGRWRSHSNRTWDRMHDLPALGLKSRYRQWLPSKYHSHTTLEVHEFFIISLIVTRLICIYEVRKKEKIHEIFSPFFPLWGSELCSLSVCDINMKLTAP